LRENLTRSVKRENEKVICFACHKEGHIIFFFFNFPRSKNKKEDKIVTISNPKASRTRRHMSCGVQIQMRSDVKDSISESRKIRYSALFGWAL
jgi:hypothetical protein